MLAPERAGRFFLVAAVVYAVLMAPWPGLERGYARLFRGGCNLVFARYWFRPEASVRFLDLTTLDPADLPPGSPRLEPTGPRDTLMTLRKRGVPTVGLLRTSSRYVGFGPTVTVLALVLATSMTLRRKAWAVLLGLALVHLFILVRLSLTLAAGGFAADKPYALWSPDAFWYGALARLESLLSDNPTVSFVVPVVVWFVVVLLVPRTVSTGSDSQVQRGKPA